MMQPITGTAWRLRCDDCGSTVTVRGTLAFSAYQEAARHGWQTSGRRDLCRRHRPEEPAPRRRR